MLDAKPQGALATPLPALDDPDGPRVPRGLPRVIDAHVHVFPDAVFDAVWRWFARHGWPIRFELHTPELLRFLFDRGVERVVALQYAHRPGMARALNDYMTQLVAAEPRVTGLATVLPGEPGAAEILDDAFAAGLAGVKIHCHVQRVGPSDPEMGEVYEACVAHDRPLVMHAGREPKSPAYARDPHTFCGAEHVARALRDHPRLRLCVAHLGADELEAHGALLERHDNLWLDTTMMLADYFPELDPWPLVRARPDRILYGSDFPNIPYAWDRELRHLRERRLPEEALASILGGNAAALFGLPG